jgi:hypothetical protein
MPLTSNLDCTHATIVDLNHHEAFPQMPWRIELGASRCRWAGWPFYDCRAASKTS